MQLAMDQLKPFGNVLEIGFRKEISEELLLQYRPKSLTILDSSEVQKEALEKWHELHPTVHCLYGSYKETLSTLGRFDLILIHQDKKKEDLELYHFLFPKKAAKNLTESQKMIQSLEGMMSQVQNRYSDGEVDDFYTKIGYLHPLEMPRFFKKLSANGNISKEQYDRIAQKYDFATLERSRMSSEDDSLIRLLEILIEKQLVVGGRCFFCSTNNSSKYDDPLFFETIITDQRVEYSEKSVQIDGVTGIIPTIKKII